MALVTLLFLATTFTGKFQPRVDQMGLLQVLVPPILETHSVAPAALDQLEMARWQLQVRVVLVAWDLKVTSRVRASAMAAAVAELVSVWGALEVLVLTAEAMVENSG
jgi:hypothetical protein